MFCPKCGSPNQDDNRFCKKCGRQLPDRSVMKPTMPSPFGSLAGQVLDGKYRIEAKLGAGGMGDVYRATRTLIGDSVAIKLLHAHLAKDPQAAERFRREAVTATKLRHRNVVAIYDVGIAPPDNTPYILMELAEGYSLRQIIEDRKILPLDFVVTVTVQVCAALDEAHRLGIVHRDIKPENIIANETANGWLIKILDFGIAKLYNQADIGLTQDGSAMGTPQYMSPEQCMGERLDERSDIYSVGILIYEMLCGSVPFKSQSAAAVALYQVQNTPPPPSALNPEIDPGVERVILKALSKQRENRQRKASDLADEMIKAATAAFRSGQAVAEPVAAPIVTPDFVPIEKGPDEPLPETIPMDVPTRKPDIGEVTFDLSKAETIESVDVEPAKTEPLIDTSATEEIDEDFGRRTMRYGEHRRKTLTPAAAPPLEKQQPTTEPVSLNARETLAPKTEQTSFDDTLPMDLDGRATSRNRMAPPSERDAEPPPPPQRKDEPPPAIKSPDEMTLIFQDAESLIDEMFPGEPPKPTPPVPPAVFAPEPIVASVPTPVAEPVVEFVPTPAVEPIVDFVPTPVAVQETVALPVQQPSVDTPSLLTSVHVALPEQKRSRTGLFIGIAIGLLLLFIFAAGGAGVGYYLWSNNTENPQTPVLPEPNSPSPPEQPQAPPGMTLVPGGSFQMGSNTGDPYSGPAHAATVGSYYIDLTEVTNESYKKFVDTGHKAPPAWKNGTFADGKANFPVTGVTFDDAAAYAKWAGKRLPTEEEWEFAARGTDGRQYPWGNDWNASLANAGGSGKGMREVGQGGKSPFGLFDMSGNAWEWTATPAKAYPGGKEFAGSYVNPMIIRGGFWGSKPEEASAVFRRAYGASSERDYGNTGFRCVKDK